MKNKNNLNEIEPHVTVRPRPASNGMKILSVSSDRKVFEKGSAVRARLLEYGSLVDELHVIIFAKSSHGFSPEKIAPNIFIYPTDSANKFLYISDAISRAYALKRRGVTINLVTTQDPFEAGIAGYRIAHIFAARLHIQIHTDFMSKYFARESLLNRGRVTIAKYLLRRASGVRVVSSRIKKSIEGFVHRDASIDVLPIFVEQPLNKEIAPEQNLKKKYPQFDFVVLVVARLAQEKNIGSAIELMEELIKVRPKAGLIIVGEGPEKAQLEDFAARLGLKDQAIFEGWEENVYPYYKTADVLVLPSFYEGYGMVAVEAVLAGCPVVMTDVGCAGDAIKNGINGLIVPVGDTKALTQAVERIASGGVKFEAPMMPLPTKQEYLAAYLKSWQDAL